MSQFMVINNRNQKIVWGNDKQDGLYYIIFDLNQNTVLDSATTRCEKLNVHQLVDVLGSYGADRLYVADTVTRRRDV